MSYTNPSESMHMVTQGSIRVWQDCPCLCRALREAKFWDKTPVGSNLRPPIQPAPLAKAFRTPVSLPSSSPTRWQMGQPLCAAQLCFLAVSMLIVRTGLCPETQVRAQGHLLSSSQILKARLREAK